MFGQVASRDGLDSQDTVQYLTAVTEAMAKLPSQLWRTGNEGFAAIAAGLDALAVQLDCARVGLISEAQSRGVVDQSPAPTAASWLLEHSLHLEPAEASRTAKLSHLCALPKNQLMAAAVAGGTVTVRKAMTALGQLAAVEHDLAPGGREQALGWLTTMAQNGHHAHVIAVGRRLMALTGADRALEHLTNTVRGAGTTLTGQDLCPATVRKFACDASIIPIVLGSEGQPLDVGRTKPLVTPWLLAALWVRDKACTFPGCGRPPNWCDAHHVRHWINGGETSLTNMALLCAHHHTYVHRWDLTATATAFGVTWHT